MASLVRESGRSTQFIVDRLVLFDGKQRVLDARVRKISLSSRNTSVVPQPGECWSLDVRLKRIRGFASPGAFDYSAYLFRRGIDATGYIIDGDSSREINREDCSYPLLEWRYQIQQKIQRLFEAEYRATALALLIGDSSGFSAEQWQQLRASGTLHLMVVSGLHIGLFAGLGFILCGGLVRLSGMAERLPGYPVAVVGAFVFAGVYTLLSGVQLPAQRAMVMLTVPLFCSLFGFKPRPSTVALIALVLVLIVDPMAPTSAGFWFSFLAVAVLMVLFSHRPQKQHYSRQIIRAQLAVFMLVSLLGLSVPMPINVAAPLVNLVAIPLVGIVLVPLLMMTMLSALLVPSLISSLMIAVGFLQGILWYAIESGALLGPVLALPALSNGLLVVSVLSVFLMVLPLSLQVRSLMIMLLGILLFGRTPQPTILRVSVLDVGQGLATVVETKRHRLLFDTGMIYSEKMNAGSAVIEPYLNRRQQIKNHQKIDRLIISHADQDHRGGADYLLSAFEISEVSVGGDPSLLQRVRGAKSCKQGEQWQWDGVKFSFLWGYAPGYTGNDGSCVLLIEYADQSALLTGDVSAKVEVQLLSGKLAQLITPVTLLVVPHHGSTSSSSWPFVKRITPTFAIASVGHNNRFGHPAASVEKRYKLVGSTFFDTAQSGTVIFSIVAKGKLQLESEYRLANRRYWW